MGFAMNPALGIANMAATQAFGKSPMEYGYGSTGYWWF
jgi:hypothetical protein